LAFRSVDTATAVEVFISNHVLHLAIEHDGHITIHEFGHHVFQMRRCARRPQAIAPGARELSTDKGLLLLVFVGAWRRWYFVAITHEAPRKRWGPSDVSLYIDGNLVQTVRAEYPSFATPPDFCRIGTAAARHGRRPSLPRH